MWRSINELWISTNHCGLWISTMVEIHKYLWISTVAFLDIHEWGIKCLIAFHNYRVWYYSKNPYPLSICIIPNEPTIMVLKSRGCGSRGHNSGWVWNYVISQNFSMGSCFRPMAHGKEITGYWEITKSPTPSFPLILTLVIGKLSVSHSLYHTVCLVDD